MAEGVNPATEAAADAEAAKAEREAQRAHRKKKARLFWMTQARVWHWISGAATLIVMGLFAFTGITLVHAKDIEAKPKTVAIEKQLPAELLAQLAAGPEDAQGEPLPQPVADWVIKETGAPIKGRTATWDPYEIAIDLPRPGGDGFVQIDREEGKVEFSTTDRGAISWLNDMHKGRNTGWAWRWFMDVFSVATLVFCISGLVLLFMHAPRRPPTWFIVGAGLLLPTLLAVFFLHA